MVQFGFLSAYDLVCPSLDDVFQTGDANGHHKVESLARIIIFE